MADTWKTAITSIEPNEVRLRGYKIDDLIGRVTFAQAVYLALKGELPSPEAGRLLDAMLRLLDRSRRHAAFYPGRAAGGLHRRAAECGRGRWHPLHQQAPRRRNRELYARPGRGYPALRAGRPGPGGRRVCVRGRVPRGEEASCRLSAIACTPPIRAPPNCWRWRTNWAWPGRAWPPCGHVEAAFAALGKPLPVNVDGAIAALLIDLEFPVELANAFFIMARVPGLVAQVYEEQTRHPPMRRLDPRESEYDGPPDRPVAATGA